MCRKVAPSPRVSATTCAARWRVMWFISISMPKVWFFMGCAPFARRRLLPPGPAVPYGRFPAWCVHPSLCRAEKSTVFLRKRRPRFLIHARRGRKKPRFFFRRAVFAARAGTPTRRPEPPPGTLSDFALVKSGRTALLRFAVKKSGGRHTSPLCSGEVGGRVCVPSRRAEVCPGGGGRIPGCAWRRPRPPHA